MLPVPSHFWPAPPEAFPARERVPELAGCSQLARHLVPVPLSLPMALSLPVALSLVGAVYVHMPVHITLAVDIDMAVCIDMAVHIDMLVHMTIDGNMPMTRMPMHEDRGRVVDVGYRRHDILPRHAGATGTTDLRCRVQWATAGPTPVESVTAQVISDPATICFNMGNSFVVTRGSRAGRMLPTVGVLCLLGVLSVSRRHRYLPAERRDRYFPHKITELEEAAEKMC